MEGIWTIEVFDTIDTVFIIVNLLTIIILGYVVYSSSILAIRAKVRNKRLAFGFLIAVGLWCFSAIANSIFWVILQTASHVLPEEILYSSGLRTLLVVVNIVGQLAPAIGLVTVWYLILRSRI